MDILEPIRTANIITQKVIEGGGELTPELEAALAISEASIATQVDKYTELMKRLESDEAYFKARADENAKIARTTGKIRERIKESLKAHMAAAGVDTLEGKHVTLKLTKAQPKLIVDDETKVPVAYQVLVKTLDKDRIKSELAMGLDVPGARLEPGTALRTYIRRHDE